MKIPLAYVFNNSDLKKKKKIVVDLKSDLNRSNNDSSAKSFLVVNSVNKKIYNLNLSNGISKF